MTIAQHNASIDAVLTSLQRASKDYFDVLLSRIDVLLENNRSPTPGEIQSLLVGLPPGITVNSITELFGEYALLSELEPDPSVAQTLGNSVVEDALLAQREGANQIVAAVLIAVLLGQSRTQINSTVKTKTATLLRGIKASVELALMTAHGAYLGALGAAQGIKSYTYTGGVIATTRDFCRRHNNKTYTRAEQRRIWSGSWGGKAPGDALTARGGYNCRHYWIPNKEAQNEET